MALPASRADLSFRIADLLFLFAVLWAPLFFGAVHLWSFSISAILASVSLALYTWSGSRLPSRAGPAGVWAIAYLTVLTLSAACSLIPHASAVSVYKTVAVIVVFIAAMYFCRDRYHIRILGTALAFLGGVLSFVGIAQYLDGLPKAWWQKPYYLSSVYVNHNHFAGLLEILLPLSLGVAIAEKDKAKRVLLVFSCGLMAAALILTLSRGGIISAAVAMVFLVFLWARRGLLAKARWGLAGLLLITAVFFYAVDLEPLFMRFRSVEAEIAAQKFDRPVIWLGALRLAASYPWLGSGPGTFEHAFLRFRPEGFAARPVHAHNDYLELLADCGLFGFAVAVGFFVWLFRSGCRTFLRGEGSLSAGIAAGALTAIFALALHSIGDFNFHVPANWLLLAVAAGMLVVLDRSNTAPAGRVSNALRVLACTAPLVAGIAGLYFGSSDLLRWKGQSALTAGEFGRARGFFGTALSVDRLDPETYYLRGLAAARSGAAADQSLRDFDSAIRLNPLEPYYRFQRAKYSGGPVSAYREVIALDPNDPMLYYLSAKELLRSTSPRDPAVEAEAQEYLLRCLTMDDAFTVRAYAALWDGRLGLNKIEGFSRRTQAGLEGLLTFLEDRGLWRLYRVVHLKLLGVDRHTHDHVSRALYASTTEGRILDISDFTSNDERPLITGKSFYRRGRAEIKVSLPGVRSLIIIRAKSNLVAGSYGYLVVDLDGHPAHSLYIDNDRYRDHLVLLAHTPGEHILGLSYVNDKVDPERGGDRNIWIQSIEVRNA